MNVLVLPLYGIGDALMCTPAVRNIKERTGARITFMHMFPTSKALLDGNPYIDENVHFPFLRKSRLQVLAYLLSLRGRYDVSFSFYPGNRRDYALAAYVAGAPLRIGHDYVLGNLSQMHFLKNRRVMEDDSLHNVQENLRLLSFIGIDDPEPYPLEIYLSDAEKQEAGRWLDERGLAGRKLVGVHPGTSAFKSQFRRRWPVERFAELMRRVVAEDPSVTALVFGGPEEAPLKSELLERAALGQRAHSADFADIRATASVISRCAGFVSNDSGLMHVAAAFQVPTAAIFGPTNPVYVRPWACPHRIVRMDGYDCMPCFRYSPIPLQCRLDGQFSCVSRLGVDSVYEALTSAMKA